MAFRDQPLGELALTIPRASALFRQYDMDYCCGGKQTLARAASRKALDVAVLKPSWRNWPNSLSPATGARRPSRRLSTISSFAITTVTVNSCRS